MNVLMMVTWYSPKNAGTLTSGVFHYEQSMDLKKQCNVAIYYPFDNQLEESFSAEEEKGILTYRTKVEPGKPFANRLKIFRDFKRIKKEFCPDVIHAHVATGAGVYGILLGKLYGIPVVVTEHSPAGLAGYNSRLPYMMAKFVYSGSKRNVCVSKNSKEEMQTFFPKCRFEVVHNGVMEPGVRAAEEIYRVDGNINMSIVAGFYSEWVKGYQFLLPAVKELAEQGYELMLHIVGGGTYFEKYRNMAKELGIEKQCIFYGDCGKSKVYDIVSQMDFGLSTSVIESAGVSVQEALMLGKPMVVTKSGGANSLVTPNVAIVVEKESTGAIVEGIKEMVARRSEFKEEYIRSYARDNFEMSEISNKYMKIYESVTGKQ